MAHGRPLKSAAPRGCSRSAAAGRRGRGSPDTRMSANLERNFARTGAHISSISAPEPISTPRNIVEATMGDAAKTGAALPTRSLMTDWTWGEGENLAHNGIRGHFNALICKAANERSTWNA